MLKFLEKFIVLFLFLTINAHSQWEYTINSSKRKSKAIGQIEFIYKKQDTLSLVLSNSRKLGLDLSLKGNVFREDQEYYILFEISERKFKPSNSIIENEKYRIFEMKDLITSEKYELEDFLKILKSGKSLTLTVRLKDRVIQGFNDLNSSFSPINSVISDRF